MHKNMEYHNKIVININNFIHYKVFNQIMDEQKNEIIKILLKPKFFVNLNLAKKYF